MTKEASLHEIRKVRAQNIDMHNQLTKLLEEKKGEVRVATQQLYVQIENFRVQQMSETRNEVAVGIDFAIKALPWWKRWNRKIVLAEAFGYMVDIREMASAEMARQKAEVDAEAEKIKREREAAKPIMNAPLTPAEVHSSEKQQVGRELQAVAQAAVNGEITKEDIQRMATAETPSELVAGPFDQDGNEVKG